MGLILHRQFSTNWHPILQNTWPTVATRSSTMMPQPPPLNLHASIQLQHSHTLHMQLSMHYTITRTILRSYHGNRVYNQFTWNICIHHPQPFHASCNVRINLHYKTIYNVLVLNQYAQVPKRARPSQRMCCIWCAPDW